MEAVAADAVVVCSLDDKLHAVWVLMVCLEIRLMEVRAGR